MPRRVLDRIREKIRQRQYDLTRYANDEAAEDLLSIADVEGSMRYLIITVYEVIEED
ncbi:MAG: hypothetical protein HY731_08865 [Candidatus Tectomicrobia bacterium]|nr:hypothetical protein [Candidatus Tectomicrobia bacterium]